MTRHEAREQAFMVLFEKTFDDELTISEIVSNAEESELLKINGFAKKLLTAVEENYDAIDEIIEKSSQSWSVLRLPKVSLAVLRLAVGEIKFVDDVPNGVAVNEAVEIAKKYGTSEDASFINGVLGAVTRA